MELLSFFGAGAAVYCCWHVVKADWKDWKNRRYTCLLEESELSSGQGKRLPPQFKLYVGKGFQKTPYDMRSLILKLGQGLTHLLVKQQSRQLKY